jgi:hypothetical protein
MFAGPAGPRVSGPENRRAPAASLRRGAPDADHRTMRRATLAVLLSVSIASAQVDHRASQSPVKNQGGRGTCVAFAVCAALETFPGVPTDLSEQLLYATVKLHQNEVDRWLRALGRPLQLGEGNSLATYVPLFELVGTCAEAFLPYDPDPRRAGPSVPEEIRRYLELAQIGARDLLAMRDAYGKYGFAPADAELLDAAAAQDIGRLQRALDEGVLAIPVTYLVHGPNWSGLGEDQPEAAAGRRAVVHPGLLHRYRRPGAGSWWSYGQAKLDCGSRGEDFVTRVRDGGLEVGADPDPKGELYGGHAVTIVGYDDRGFLIKNSWGEAWGEGGYATLLYDYHALYATAALLLREARIRMPALSPFEKRSRIERGAHRLKIQPRGAGADARLLLSSWMLEARDADVEVVEYRVEARDGDGIWAEVAARRVHAGPLDGRRGAPFAVPRAALAGARAVRVTVRYGDLPLGDPGALGEARILAAHRFPEFPPDLGAAIDLEPQLR